MDTTAIPNAINLPEFDPARPSSARIYDCMLGGTDHYVADRRAVAMIRAVLPEVEQAAWANRGFHQRAAIWMARQGITQFLDLGCGLPAGLPAVETTHQVVQRVNPAARVAYVDHDPTVIAHARALLTTAGTTSVIQADVRDPVSLLAAVHLDGLIELARPAGLLVTAVLDHIADEDDPRGCLARLVAALAPGSYVALSHLTGDQMPPRGRAAIVAAYQDAPSQIHPRTRAEVAAFLDGLDLIAPYPGAARRLCRIGLWGAEDPAAADDDSSRWWWAAVAHRASLPRADTPGEPASTELSPVWQGCKQRPERRPPGRSHRALISDGNCPPPTVSPTSGGFLAFAPDEPPLSEEDAEAQVHGICFKTGPPGRVGVELEWLVRDIHDPFLRVPGHRIRQAVASLSNGSDYPRLPGGGTLTTEPGGQLEVSSLPAADLAGCIDAAGLDFAALRDAARAAGLQLAGDGIDPIRPPRRVLDLPRYAAMEEFFDRRGPWGREMMCNTASVQVCLDAGDDGPGAGGYRWRWRLVHAIGPVLVATFANSPLRGGRVSGWRSTRQAVWSRLDPGRTRPPPGAEPARAGKDSRAGDGNGASPPGGQDPRAAWASYALDAELVCIRRDAPAGWSAPPGLTFRDWLRGAGERRPTAEDLAYHLSTLFPPVRPRGHLELRMIDAQPADGWIVPLAVVTALVDDPRAADEAMAAAEPVWHQPAAPPADSKPWPDADPWLRAARHGPSDAVLRRASQTCFEAAEAALSRAGAPAVIRRAVAAFAARYVDAGRCPADDRLEEDR